ncbi:MAG TPA: FHA domain-containing protein [Polyangiaceae bacterium]|jgi:ribosomal protein S18 acetylase RimI-like enzyme|nr:FHA domain-containing protein [Polyangiaceae bacterium]
MKTLRLHIDVKGRRSVLAFNRLPVRIGRDPVCECRLEFVFVSRVHAQIELVEGRLVLRDENSRQGVLLGSGKVAATPGEAVELTPHGNEFHIGSIAIRAEICDDDVESEASSATTEDDRTESLDRGEVQTSYYANANVDPKALDAQAIEQTIRELVDRERHARADLARALHEASALDSWWVRQIAQALVEQDPEWDTQSSVRQFVTASGVSAVPTRPEALALRGLQELAAHYVPYAPPLTTGQAVMRFLERLDGALATALDGLAEIRAAYGELPDSGISKEARRDGLGGQLLDWTTSSEPSDRLREDVDEMAAYPARLVSEIATGLEVLLTAMNPASIERASRAHPWRPFRHRPWAEYLRRYKESCARAGALGPLFASAARATQCKRAIGSSERIVLPDNALGCAALPA